MNRDLPKHCSYAPCRKKGPYIYFVKDGSRVTMPGRYPLDQTSAEFWAKYAKCLTGQAALNVGRRTLGELIKKYRASDEFAGLRAGTTQKTYNRYLKRLNERAGHVLVKRFKKPDLIALRDAFKDKPATANYILTVATVVFEEGVNLDWIQHNPARGVKKLKDQAEQRLPWNEDDIERYHAIAGDRESLVLELAVNTGQRIADVLNMRWDQLVHNNEAGGKLGTWVTQEKTGRRLFIVFSQRLCQILEDAERASEFIICNNKTGEQLAYTGIEQAVRKLRHKLGIKKTIHDWRHTTAHRLASAGCHIEHIQAITGHTNSAIVRRYANETLQINQAVKAIDALDALDVL